MFKLWCERGIIFVSRFLASSCAFVKFVKFVKLELLVSRRTYCSLNIWVARGMGNISSGLPVNRPLV